MHIYKSFLIATVVSLLNFGEQGLTMDADPSDHCSTLVQQNTSEAPETSERLSSFTLEKLSEETQSNIKKYNTILNQDGLPSPESKIYGKYCIDFSKEIGRGAEGDIYLCQHLSTKQFRAAKRKFLNSRHETDREYGDYKALGRLHEVFYDTISKYGQMDKAVLYIIDLVDGIESHQVFGNLLNKTKATDPQRVHLAYNLLQELKFTLSKGVCQADQNSGNVMIDHCGEYRLVDFGDKGSRIKDAYTNLLTENAKISQAYKNHLRFLWCKKSSPEDYFNNNQSSLKESPYFNFINILFSEEELALIKTANMLKELMIQNKHPMLELLLSKEELALIKTTDESI